MMMETKTTCIRMTLATVSTCAAICLASVARCEEYRSARPDAAIAAELLNCDSLAERQREQVANLTPIAPTSVLNPILLLNDLNRRKQEEANQPRQLEQIELVRQQCRRDVEARASRRIQELADQKLDSARGY